MTEVEIVPLGTASALPTRTRHPSSIALVREGRILLFDCGEGAQMRLIDAGLKPTRIDAVFITHLHGDHYFGLMGLISTLSMMDRENLLTIVAPAGLPELFDVLPGVDLEWLSFPVEFVELDGAFRKEVVFETDEFHVEARPLEHRTLTAGYRFEERPRPGHLDAERAKALGVSDYAHFRALKRGDRVRLPGGREIDPSEVVGPEQPGRSFAYVTDTRPCENGRILARNADLVYHDATFMEAFRSRAVETAHATAAEAATVARNAGAKKLLIGHFSARHADPSGLLREAREVFKNTEVAEELKRYALRE